MNGKVLDMNNRVFIFLITFSLIAAIPVFAEMNIAADSEGGLMHRIVKLSDYATTPYVARGAVLTAIELNPLLAAREITVVPMDRKLMIGGKVRSESEKDLALYLARTFSEDLDIMDALEVDEKLASAVGTKAGAVSDATAAFAARDLLMSPAYSGMDLEPVCEDGLLTLTGPMPTSGMRRTISNALSAVPGVREIAFADSKTGDVAMAPANSSGKESFFSKVGEKARKTWNRIRGRNDEKAEPSAGSASAPVSGTSSATASVSSATASVSSAVSETASSADRVSEGVETTASVDDEDWKDRVVRKGKAAGEKMGTALKKTGKVVSDGWITTKISTVFAFNRHVNPLNVRVKTRNGEVVLYGNARTQAEYDMAEKIAQNVDGVVRIVNRLSRDWE